MSDLSETRRRFMTYFAGIGLGSTLAPGVVWARMQDAATQTITMAMITEALKLSGIELSEDERKAMVDSANQNLKRYEELRAIHIPNDVSPPFHFSPVVPGMIAESGAAGGPGFASATDIANLTGFPDLIVPAGFTGDNLPVGISFFGPAFSEPKLLSLGFSFEQATHARRRPVHTPARPGEAITIP